METESGLLLLQTLFSHSFIFQIVTAIFLLLLFLFFVSLTVGCEVAFLSLQSKDLEILKKEKSRIAKLILRYTDLQGKLLSTVKSIRILTNVFIVMIVTVFIYGHVKELPYRHLIFFAEFIVLGNLIFLFHEKLPKLIIRENPLRYARYMVGVFYILEHLVRPFATFFISNNSIVNDKIVQSRYKLSINELENILDLNSLETEEEKSLIKGIMNFGDTDVKEVMKSRVDVVAVDINDSFESLNEIIVSSGYSRIPVYEDSFDNIRGILYVKDLWPLLYKNGDESIEWEKMLRPAYFVPESKKIRSLLQNFKDQKIHMAIVNDEYGGTHGIVTLEDILEEIVGEIADESDDEELYFTKIDENNYLFEGKILLNDFAKILDIDDSLFDEIEGDYDTLAGLILDLKGEMPKKGEILHFKNFTFKIEVVDNRRIVQIKVTINKEEENIHDS